MRGNIGFAQGTEPPPLPRIKDIPQKEQPHKKPRPQQFSLEGILGSLGISSGIDSDRILILGLLLLLSSEECDRLLLLALMYILL